MATSTPLSGRITLDGEDAKRALAELTQAVRQFFGELKRAGSELGEIRVPTEKARGDLTELARAGVAAFEDIGKAAGALKGAAAPALGELKDQIKEVEDSSSGLVKILGNVKSALSGGAGKTVLIGAGAVAGLAGLFKLVKDGVANFDDLEKKADEAKLSLEEFQKLRFIFRELGLGAKEADKAIENLTDVRQKAAAVGLTVEAFEKLKKQIEDTGLSADAAEKKIKELRAVRGPEQLAQDARDATSATLALAVAEERLRIAQGEKPDADLARELAEKKALLDVEQARARVEQLRKEASARLGPKIITTPEVVNAESLVRLRDVVKEIDNFDRQVERAKRLLGDEDLAKKFVGSVNTGQFDEFIKRFDILKKVTDESKESAKEFNKAQDNLKQSLFEVGFAADQGRTSLALTLAPGLTPIINGVANGIRFLNVNLRELAADIGTTVKPVIEDFFRGLAAFDSEGKSTFAVTLKENIIAFGAAVADVFNNVIKPAFFGLIEVANEVARSINEVFGTKISGAFVAILAGLSTFIGGWKLLAIAVLAAIGALANANAEFGAFFQSLGIDLRGAIESIKAFAAALKLAATTGDFSKLQESIGKLPTIILAVAAAFVALRAGAALLGSVLTRLFGVEITAGPAAFLLVIGQITGVLPLLTTLLGGAAALSVIVINSFQFLMLLLGGFGTAIVAAIAAIFIFRDELKQAAENGSVLAKALLLVADAVEIVARAIPDLVTGIISVIDTALPILAKFAEAMFMIGSGNVVGGAKAVAELVKLIDDAAVKLLKLDQGKKALAQEAGLDDIGKSADGSGTKVDTLRKKVEELVKSFRVPGLGDGISDQLEKLRSGASGAAGSISNSFKDAASDVKSAMTDMGSGASVGAAEVEASIEKRRTKILDFSKAVKALTEDAGGPAPGMTPIIDPRTGEVLGQVRSQIKGATDDVLALKNALLQLGDPVSELGSKFVDTTKGVDQVDSAIERLVGPDKLKQLGVDAEQTVRPIDRIDGAFDALIQKQSSLEQLFDGAKTKAQELLDVATRVASALNPISSAQAATLPGGPVAAPVAPDMSAVTAAFETIKAAADAAAAAVVAAFQQAAISVQQMNFTIDFSSLVASAEAAANSAVAAMQRIVDKANEAASAAASAAAPDSGGGTSGFASGGKLYGPGSGTSDSILIRGSKGEWMINASASRYYGDALMGLINAARIPRQGLLAALPRFSLGGMIDSLGAALMPPLPRFAAGGAIAGALAPAAGGVRMLHPVPIHFNGKHVGTLLGSPKVVEELRKAAAQESLVSMYKPSHYK